MKESYFLRFSLFLVTITLISSCKSTHFITRKYTSGYYRATKHTIERPSYINSNKPVYASNKKELDPLDFKATIEGSEIIHKNNKNKTTGDDLKTKCNSNNNLKETFKKISTDFFKSKQNQKQNKKVKTGNNSNKKIDTTALLGFLFAMAIVVFILAILILSHFNLVIPISYGWLLPLGGILRLLFGITGFVFGIKARKKYKKNKGSSLEYFFIIIAHIVGILCLITLYLLLMILMLISV